MRPSVIFAATVVVCTLCLVVAVAAGAGDPKGYFAALGVEPGASAAQLKAAYKRKVLQWHPDKAQKQQKEAYEAQFIKVKEAYEVLSDATKRANYERYGDEEGANAGYANGYGGYGRNQGQQRGGFFFNFGGGYAPPEGIVSDTVVLNHENWDYYVMSDEGADQVWLVEVYSDGCRPCREFAPIWEDVYSRVKGMVHMGRINADENRRLVSYRLRVHNIPTILGIYRGQMRTFGLYPMTASRLYDFALAMVPKDHVSVLDTEARLKVFVDGYDHSDKPRVLLFSDKARVPLVYRHVSRALQHKMEFGFVRLNNGMALGRDNPHAATLLERLQIDSLPTVAVIRNQGLYDSRANSVNDAVTLLRGRMDHATLQARLEALQYRYVAKLTADSQWDLCHAGSRSSHWQTLKTARRETTRAVSPCLVLLADTSRTRQGSTDSEHQVPGLDRFMRLIRSQHGGVSARFQPVWLELNAQTVWQQWARQTMGLADVNERLHVALVDYEGQKVAWFEGRADEDRDSENARFVRWLHACAHKGCTEKSTHTPGIPIVQEHIDTSWWGGARELLATVFGWIASGFGTLGTWVVLFILLQCLGSVRVHAM